MRQLIAAPAAVIGKQHNALFLRIELASLADGAVLASMTAIVLDDQGPELLDQEVAIERVNNVDQLVSFIRTHVRIGDDEDVYPSSS